MIFFVLLFLFVIICSIIALIKIREIFISVRKKKYVEFLIYNSISLKNLDEINTKYDFYTNVNNFDKSHVYDNENFYDCISCEDYLIYQLQYKKFDIEKEIKHVDYNKSKYELYCKEISNIKEFGKYLNTNSKLNREYLLTIEKALFYQRELKPVINFSIHITLYCSTINGYIYKNKKQSFSSEYITSLIKKLNNKNRNFYNDKEIWNALCRVERGKVSNKMRFSIYKRDGYRCCICGRSEISDRLEIDHIKPIAKGGKSTYDNLQTLCRRCNKNKGDKY